MSECNYIEIETTGDVYCAIVRAHQDRLVVFSTYTSDVEADTTWGFAESGTPILHANTRWSGTDEDTRRRIDEKHHYWLCFPREVPRDE